MRFHKTAVFMLLGVGLWVQSCKHDPVIPEKYTSEKPYDVGICNPDTVYFEKDVLPILLANCATSGCHDQGTAADGVVLTDYTNVKNTGEISPGNPGNSEIYEVIVDNGEDRMPPAPANPLSPEAIAVIEKWIKQGALNLTCSDTGSCDTVNVSFSANVNPMLSTYCISCHSGSAPQGGVNLSGYANVKIYVDNGKLLGSIEHKPGFVAMPQGSKLSDCNIGMVRNWIAEGALDN